MTLKFKETFPQRHRLTITDIPTVMKCKNIDFGHVNWNSYIMGFFSHVIIKDIHLLKHLTNNIIDVHVRGHNNKSYYSFINGVGVCGNETAFKYVINNRSIDNEFFDKISDDIRVISSDYRNKLKELVRYLTDTSLNKFAGFYNTDEFYNMIYIMMLVTRVQKSLPKSIIKHLIIPFVYQ